MKGIEDDAENHFVMFVDIRNLTQFFVARRKCPSSSCATAENLACNDIDIFSKRIRSLKHILGQ